MESVNTEAPEHVEDGPVVKMGEKCPEGPHTHELPEYLKGLVTPETKVEFVAAGSLSSMLKKAFAGLSGEKGEFAALVKSTLTAAQALKLAIEAAESAQSLQADLEELLNSEPPHGKEQRWAASNLQALAELQQRQVGIMLQIREELNYEETKARILAEKQKQSEKTEVTLEDKVQRRPL